jgi:CheY-like chemotaxis protein
MVLIPYDIILVDINSYIKIDDLDLTLLIKKQQPNRTIPIILITGEQEIDLSHHNQSRKNPLYFKKPLTQNGAMKVIDYLTTTLKIKGTE